MGPSAQAFAYLPLEQSRGRRGEAERASALFRAARATSGGARHTGGLSATRRTCPCAALTRRCSELSRASGAADGGGGLGGGARFGCGGGVLGYWGGPWRLVGCSGLVQRRKGGRGGSNLNGGPRRQWRQRRRSGLVRGCMGGRERRRSIGGPGAALYSRPVAHRGSSAPARLLPLLQVTGHMWACPGR